MQWLHPHLFFFWAGRGRGRRGTVERWVRVILYVQKRKTKTNRNTSLIISYQILHRLKYDYTITPARWEGRDSAFLRLTPVTQSCSARSEGRNSGWVLWDVRSPPEQVGWLVTFTTAVGSAVISSTPELRALIPFRPLFAIQPTHTGIFSQKIGIGIRQEKRRQIFLQNVINR